MGLTVSDKLGQNCMRLILKLNIFRKLENPTHFCFPLSWVQNKQTSAANTRENLFRCSLLSREQQSRMEIKAFL